MYEDKLEDKQKGKINLRFSPEKSSSTSAYITNQTFDDVIRENYATRKNDGSSKLTDKIFDQHSFLQLTHFNR